MVEVMVDGRLRLVVKGTAPNGGVSYSDPGRWADWTVVLNTSERWAGIDVKVESRLGADDAALLAATIAYAAELAALHNGKEER